MLFKNRILRLQLSLVKYFRRMEHALWQDASRPEHHHFMSQLPDTRSAQDILHKGLTEQEDFLLLRFGLYEYHLCLQFLEKANGLRQAYSKDLLYHLPLDTGIFGPTDNSYDIYAKNIISSLDQVDVLSYWTNIPPPFLFSRFYSRNIRYINVKDLYPYPFWHKQSLPTWQSWLTGKRVLVISSFADTVRKQYERRNKIWRQTSILPLFTLITYQAVQTNGGNTAENFLSWQDALWHMIDQISQIHFDIALISCGGYGMPLALELHRLGKRAVQWGGCYQLWFGIMGGRWDRDPNITPYFNPSWTYPSPSETPPLSKLVDNASYWKPEAS